MLGDALEHFIVPFFGFAEQSGGNLVNFVVGAHGLVVPEDSLHGDEVYDALEGLFSSDRNLDGAGICAENLAELADNLEEVCTRAVHLVDVADTRNVIFVGLTPHCLRLRLYAADGTECSDGTVENAERTFNLYGEVHVSRGVD